MIIVRKILSILLFCAIATIIYNYGKKNKFEEKVVNKIIKHSIILFFILQFIYFFTNKELLFSKILSEILVPQKINFIFISLIVFPLLIKIFNENKNLFIISFCISIISNIFGFTNILGINLLVVFFPFFVLGYNIEKVKKINIKKLIFLIFFNFLCVLICKKFDYDLNNILSMNLIKSENITLYSISILIRTLIMYTLFNIVPYIKINLSNNIDLTLFFIILTKYIIDFITVNLKVTFITKGIINIISLILLFLLIKVFKEKKLKNKKIIKKEINNKMIKKENKIKKFLNFCFSSNFVLIILILILTYKSFVILELTYLESCELKFENIIDYIILNAIILIFLILPLTFIKNSKIKAIIALLIDISISLLLFSDSIYFRYSSNLISVLQLENSKYSNEIIKAIPQLLRKKQIMLFFDIIPFIVGTILSDKIIIIKEKYKKNILIVVTILTLTGNIFINKLNEIKNYIYDKATGVINTTIYIYHINDIKTGLTYKKDIPYKTKEEVLNAYSKIKTDNKNKYTGIAKNKNIVMLQLEAIENFVINKKINNQEITPNMNKWLKENISINNLHIQSYASTADSEFSVLTSLFPLENGLAYQKFCNSKYIQLYDDLNKNGYFTAYAHGNRKEFWNRGQVYNNFNVQNKKYINDFYYNSHRVSGYMSDETLYHQIIEDMENYKEPFFQFIVASSSHVDFKLYGLSEEERKEKVNIDVGKYKGKTLGNYIEACRYADYCFGKFIEELKSTGLYEDLVLIVYGDHYAIGKDDADLIEFLSKYNQNSYKEVNKTLRFSNVMAGMKIPGANNIQINYPTSKIDIKPTVLDILGIKDEFSLGTSIFNKREYISLNNGIIITPEYLYNNNNWYSINDGKIIDLNKISVLEKNKLENYKKEAIEKIKISNSVSIGNSLSK